MVRHLIAMAFVFCATPIMAVDIAEEQTIKPASSEEDEATGALRETVTKINGQFSRDSSNLLLFARLADKNKSDKAGYQIPSNTIVKVMDANSWPDDTVTSYIVLVDDSRSVIAFQEVPVSESGDWFNVYTHYYDEMGNTISFQRYSSFFNGCPDSPSNETSTYYYRQHKLIAKDYALNGAGDKVLDPAKCGFMYRYVYTIQKNWEESKKVSGLEQVWE